MGAPYCAPERDKVREMGAKICFLGAPWDLGTIVRTGTSSGPHGVREASTQYFPYMFEYDVDLMTFFRVVDCGDIPIVPSIREHGDAGTSQNNLDDDGSAQYIETMIYNLVNNMATTAADQPPQVQLPVLG